MHQSNSQAENHRSIALDESKRHFVFGDIHGRFATFQGLLNTINYDSSTDVIYSVGDLIDRGPDSASVVEFFQQPHCHVVLGNHEQMTLNQRDWKAIWKSSRAGGLATLDSLEQSGYTMEWLVKFCSGLPICLDVGDETQAASFRLIHAECPLDWSESELMKYLRVTARKKVAESRLLWGRTDISTVYNHIQTGTRGRVFAADNRSSRAVFCGHTPLLDVISAHNVSWIDTFAGGVMSCMDPMAMQVFEHPIVDR